jgi:hypothetical protein
VIRVTSGTSVAGSTVSEISDDDLSWDSELDGPIDSDDDDDDDIPLRRGPDFMMGPGGPHPGPRRMQGDESEDEFERDPWNAVCVVGLRIYSKDTEVQIEVVKPEPEKNEDEEKDLDVDDAARDATTSFEEENEEIAAAAKGLAIAEDDAEISK